MTELSRIKGDLLCSVIVCTLSMARCGAQTIPATASGGNGLDDVVENVVQPFVKDSCHVGLSIAVVRGRDARFFNFGYTSRGATIKPQRDSIYEIASVTKTFTGALAATAIVQHRMKLDTDFRQYLPQQYPNLAWNGHPITLRSLATHTSGIPRDLPDTDDLFAHRDPETLPYKLLARDGGYDRALYLRELHNVALRSEPGTKEDYSNLGFKVICWGLEEVYGMSFERLMQDTILRPLGMRSTTLVLSPEERGRLVKGYSPAGHLMPYHLRNAGAAYGLYSTPRDLAKYVQWQLDESDPVIELAHTPIKGHDQNGKGLVWNLAVLDGSRELWHGGGTFGMSSQVVLFPESHEGYVLLANDTCKGTEEALKNLAISLHERIHVRSAPAADTFHRPSQKTPLSAMQVFACSII